MALLNCLLGIIFKLLTKFKGGIDLANSLFKADILNSWLHVSGIESAAGPGAVGRCK
jgi:hypothetical protein